MLPYATTYIVLGEGAPIKGGVVRASAVVQPVVGAVVARVFGVVGAEHDDDDVPLGLRQRVVLRTLPIPSGWVVVGGEGRDKRH